MKIFLLIYIIANTVFSYPMFEILTNNNPLSEDIVINIKGGGLNYMAIIDSALSVNWSVLNRENSGWDFKVNNNNKLTFFAMTDTSWYSMDDRMSTYKINTNVNDYYIDNHDIQFLESGGYLVHFYAFEEIDIPQTSQIDTAKIGIVHEYDSEGEMIFEWKYSDHVSIDEYIDFFNLNSPRLRWNHINSIDIDTDSNIIISNRAMSEAVKFDRDSGEIIWILGGPSNDFVFTNDPYNGFIGQHDVRRIENGNILVFDNGQSNNSNQPPRPARIVEYSLDEDNMIADMQWQYIHPNEYYAMNQGSVQRLENGNTFICWGTILGRGAVITEVSQQGNIELEIEYPDGYNAYRVYKNDFEFSISLDRGDINLDDRVDILDIITSVNLIIGSNNINTILNLHKIDLNNDAQINISDIVLLVQLII